MCVKLADENPMTNDVCVLRCESIPRVGDTIVLCDKRPGPYYIKVARVVHYAGPVEDSQDLEVSDIHVYVTEPSLFK